MNSAILKTVVRDDSDGGTTSVSFYFGQQVHINSGVVIIENGEGSIKIHPATNPGYSMTFYLMSASGNTVDSWPAHYVSKIGERNRGAEGPPE